jgi:branched-chain amino acid transport system permease protein
MTAATATTMRPAWLKPVRLGEAVERVAGSLILLGAVVWLIANLVKDPTRTLTVLLEGLNNGALYALIALGYTLVYGIIELINFAHGDLFMLGTVLSAHMTVEWLGIHGGAGAVGELALTFVVTMAFCALINVGAEFFAYRRLRSAPKLAPLITAVGLSFIFQNIGQRPWASGSGQRNWATVLTPGGFSVGGVVIRYNLFVVLGVTAVLLVLLTFIVQKTSQGKAMRATAQDQDGARLMGINVNRTISLTFALGGAMAGAAGVLYVQTIGQTRFDLGFQLGLIAFTAAVLGGIGNLTGAVLGGFLIGVIENVNNSLGLGQAWGQTVIFSILIVLMVFKPEGILGKPTTEKV